MIYSSCTQKQSYNLPQRLMQFTRSNIVSIFNLFRNESNIQFVHANPSKNPMSSRISFVFLCSRRLGSSRQCFPIITLICLWIGCPILLPHWSHTSPTILRCHLFSPFGLKCFYGICIRETEQSMESYNPYISQTYK